jgi:biotin synthase
MLARARQLRDMGARAFGVVASGSRPSAGELERICRVVERVRTELGLEPCVSLGRVTAPQLRRLREAGLARYHHNLEAARSFFPQVITTYEYQESVETIERAHQAGLAVCSSGVFGMGESAAQRVELIEAIRDLRVESIPICFLEPHPGTPLGGRQPLDAEEALAIIAVHRLLLPDREIIVTGGRRLVLGGMTDQILEAGAEGVMIEDYPSSLTGELSRDLRAIREAGMSPRPPATSCGG